MTIAGDRRHRVTLERLTRTADGAGGYTEAWARIGTDPRYARVSPASARDVERVFGAKVQAPISHLVVVRHRSSDALTAADRVRFGTRALQIRGIQNVDERNIDLVLACEELT